MGVGAELVQRLRERLRRRARRHPRAPAQDLRVRRAAPVRRHARRRRPAGQRRGGRRGACAPASSTQTPFVARGAGSGLSGGALPVADGIVIGLSRLRRVLDVDLDNGRVVVEPGVTNIEVSDAVGPTHFYPPDPSSQIVCTIGGNVAENSGGAHCLKYGFTTNYVLGVEAVLADGTLRARSAAPQADLPGYDLLGALVGSEGTLAVVTKVTLRVVPVPEAVRTLVAFFDSPARRPARPSPRSPAPASSPARSR